MKSIKKNDGGPGEEKPKNGSVHITSKLKENQLHEYIN